MPYKPEHILTHDEVKSVLQQAWNLGSPMLHSKLVSNFKIKDFEVLENELTEFFKKSSRFSIEVPSAGALLKLLQNGDTKRNKAIAVVSFYVLLKLDLLTIEEKNKLSSQIYGKNVFSDYTNRVKVLTRIKEYLSDEQIKEISETPANVVEVLPEYQTTGRFRIPAIILLSLALVALTVIRLWPYSTVNESDIIWEIANIENVSNSDIRVSVIYDLNDIKYSKATLDFGDGRVLDLKKSKGEISHNYFKPQIKWLTLIIDERKFVKTFTLPSRGWIASVDNAFFHDSSYLHNSSMHLVNNDQTKQILLKDEFYVVYRKIQDFDFELDNLSFETKIKNPQAEGGISCFDVSLDLSGVEGDTTTAVSFNLLNPDCTSWAKIKVGEVKLHSGNHDLTASGQSLEDWRIVKGEVKDKILKIYIDDVLLYSITYHKPLGKLKLIQILFKGNGSVDYFKIKSTEGKVLYYDDFEKIIY